MCTETFQVVNRTYNAEQFHQKVDKVVCNIRFRLLLSFCNDWKCPREVEREKKLDKKHTAFMFSKKSFTL